MFLDRLISLTDLRCKMHVMNHANRLAETLLISPFISFILYRGISRVIGLMPDKRLETQSFCLPFAACNCDRPVNVSAHPLGNILPFKLADTQQA